MQAKRKPSLTFAVATLLSDALDTNPKGIPAPQQATLPACFSTIEAGLTDCLTYLCVQRRLSPQTLRAYKVDVAEWLGWLEHAVMPVVLNNPQQEAALLFEAPSKFMAWLSKKKFARSSMARKASSLRTVLKFLMKEDYFPVGTFNLRFHRPKLQQRLPQFLTETTINQLSQAIEGNTLWHKDIRLRNQAILWVLFTSGLRVSECASLKVDAVNWQTGELRVTGKGNRERLAFISKKTLSLLKDWLKERTLWLEAGTQQEKTRSAYLFLNQRLGGLTDRSIHRIVMEIGVLAGLAEPLHPHLFRHSFATHLLNKGVELRLVQELLGHVSIRSTQIYTHLSTERLRSAYLKAHPLAQSC
jgi:integrase/recombinase XerC